MTFRSTFEHHDELLHASLDEFCTHGYDAASVNRILERSGVSKGQLYHHFGSKQGLFLGLVEWLMDEKSRWVAANHPGEVPDEFFAALDQQIVLALDFSAAHPDADRLATAVLAERGRPIYKAIVERLGFDAGSPLDLLVDHHAQRGAFAPELTLDLVKSVVHLLVNHAPEILDLDRPQHLAERRNELLHVLRHGLAPRDGLR